MPACKPAAREVNVAVTLVFYLLFTVISGLRVLVVHPLYAGSHVLTLQVKKAYLTLVHQSQMMLCFLRCDNFCDTLIWLTQSVTEELLLRGHHVTTVKFRDTALPPLRTAGHSNFTLVSIRNS